MIEIDGSYGEGGGQILRTSIALSSVTGKPIKVKNIRANRPRPGLYPQHITAIQSVAKICSAEVKGLAKGSHTIEFNPKGIEGGRFFFDVGTAGSVTLVLQACLLPTLFSREKTILTITGGTDVKWSPPIDYFHFVHLPLLKKMGVGIKLELTRRGYYPKGGGKIVVEIEPVKNLKGLLLGEKGDVRSIRGIAYASHLPIHIPERMRKSAIEELEKSIDTNIEIHVQEDRLSFGQGTGIVLWGETNSTILGASCLGEKGVPAEKIGERAARDLVDEIRSSSTLDVHATDQLLPYMALASTPSIFLARKLSEHAKTNMWLIKQLLEKKFYTKKIDNIWEIKC